MLSLSKRNERKGRKRAAVNNEAHLQCD